MALPNKIIPLFSIIIPCFNVAKSVAKSVNSILNQKTQSNLEIILIDDKSTDETFIKLQQLEEKYTNIVLLQNAVNKGVSYTRNKGLELASGEFIIFLDADDTFNDGLFDNLTDQINKNNDIDLISFSFIRDGGDHRTYQSYSQTKYNKQIFTKNDFLTLFLLREINQHLCSFTIRKNIIDQYCLRFDESMHYGEDVEFQIKCMFHANKIMYLSENYFIYAYNELSVTNNFDENKRTSPVIILNKIEQYIKGYNNSEILPYLNLFYIYNIFGTFKQMIIHNAESNLSTFSEESKPIINREIKFNLLNKQGIVVTILQFLYRINPKLLFFMLRKIA